MQQGFQKFRGLYFVEGLGNMCWRKRHLKRALKDKQDFGGMYCIPGTQKQWFKVDLLFDSGLAFTDVRFCLFVCLFIPKVKNWIISSK